VIRTVATSILRDPTMTRSSCALASPARTSSTICAMVTPRAISEDLVTPCGLAAINSSVRGDQTVESEGIVGLARR
jgi:hypothetical protein